MARAAILYDRDCGFCRWATDKLLAWDRRRAFRAVALQDPEAERLLADVPADRRMTSWHLVTADGRVRSAGAAAAALLRSLPGGRPLATVAEAFPGSTELLYSWVARHRDLLGRLLGTEACRVDPRDR